MSFNILTDSPPLSTKTDLYTKPTFPKFISALQSIPNSFTKIHFNFSSLKPTAHSISAAGFVPKTVSDLKTQRILGFCFSFLLFCPAFGDGRRYRREDKVRGPIHPWD
ncbi:hypothetical protein SADUNF_Sadunf15G0123200 [Salix dunnii]|uniref:Uncharacterized protein n=1 Tax=Salix dunnii TaxID=1413687 RepID=A0A835JDA6_9ROSI|nr:hypothetical protein SADUNF_Sadunf15G0123200 [Salix dunnii]